MLFRARVRLKMQVSNFLNHALNKKAFYLRASLTGLLTIFIIAASPYEGFCITYDKHFQEALHFQLNNDTQAAIAAYKRGLEMSPEAVDGHINLGILLLEEVGDIDGAISEFTTALHIDPACYSCQRYLDEALEIMNSSDNENIERGNKFYKQGNMVRACAAYRIATFLAPTNAEAHNCLAWTLYRMGQLQEGLKHIKIALKLKPHKPEFVNTLACVLLDCGELEKAITTWRKAMAKSKVVNAADHYGLAVGYLAKKDIVAAVRNFKEALKIDPHYRSLDYLRNIIGMSPNALATHEKLLSLTFPK